eukprot:CAMPEP_0115341370 /NCGR_PEP_ID=MMETSP0270-20121206/91638_1 /TAXON_ID=71861 /ORGANISM="Scrippsiella trochoidea, Strain CCMP3099" /LENGTH=54 /DNA_ID=CAMNT_0002762875 /DNA_START=161 /DNA_END=325 /DNA_ORIENTATION=-
MVLIVVLHQRGDGLRLRQLVQELALQDAAYLLGAEFAVSISIETREGVPAKVLP